MFVPSNQTDNFPTYTVTVNDVGAICPLIHHYALTDVVTD